MKKCKDCKFCFCEDIESKIKSSSSKEIKESLRKYLESGENTEFESLMCRFSPKSFLVKFLFKTNKLENWSYCHHNREDGFLKSRICGTCGKEGRFFRSKNYNYIKKLKLNIHSRIDEE